MTPADGRRPGDRRWWVEWPGALGDGLLAVIVAPRCSACECLLDRPTQGPVCARCWCAIRPLTPPLCGLCGAALPSWRPDSRPTMRCRRCRLPRSVARARSVGEYDGALRTILHALKYGRQRSLAPALGRTHAPSRRVAHAWRRLHGARSAASIATACTRLQPGGRSGGGTRTTRPARAAARSANDAPGRTPRGAASRQRARRLRSPSTGRTSS